MNHAQKVERVATQLRNRKSTAPLSRQKRVVSHQVPKVHDKKHTDEKIDLTDFDQVLEIDTENRICVAEPGVPFCELVDQTLPLGLVPIVVPAASTTPAWSTRSSPPRATCSPAPPTTSTS
jgi:hypothetical protein